MIPAAAGVSAKRHAGVAPMAAFGQERTSFAVSSTAERPLLGRDPVGLLADVLQHYKALEECLASLRRSAGLVAEKAA